MLEVGSIDMPSLANFWHLQTYVWHLTEKLPRWREFLQPPTRCNFSGRLNGITAEWPRCPCSRRYPHQSYMTCFRRGVQLQKEHQQLAYETARSGGTRERIRRLPARACNKQHAHAARVGGRACDRFVSSCWRLNQYRAAGSLVICVRDWA